jgi:hypothetical protein
MELANLVRSRRTAEEAVLDMADGPLKTAAFETILSQLIRQELNVAKSVAPDAAAARRPAARKKVAGQRSDGTTSRLLNLVEEGFFSQQRSLSEIRTVLAERGFHYQVEDLGTPVTRLVRRKYLRRVQVSENRKKLWKYSNY